MTTTAIIATATTTTTTTKFRLLPTFPHQLSISQSRYNGKTLSFPKSSISRHIPLSSSSSSSSSSSQSPIKAEEEEASASPPSMESLPPISGCKACGREELEKGCNGEGRIQGGIATVPGFGWWPIKAYRPCPGFVASGGRYRRRGQTMDEVGFGGGD
ncbi:Synaptojanin-1 like [Actinidia chinensis var. chinensis]|uniref:Synaptojanin-1 like n=1 Tax=Actinidia chinensis var. chinensis TaxID=1590841 RepID=A0A2R6PHT1_ACTCC|nr:Synaptojanin-1 like [Actinidia chinensis var. chinensis]